MQGLSMMKAISVMVGYRKVWLRGIRIGLWLLGATYLFLEAREVIAREQINNISFFALLFVLASYQLSVSWYFLTLQHLNIENGHLILVTKDKGIPIWNLILD